MNAINELAEEGEFLDKTNLQNFFEKHNFAKEFSKTWTIFIEKDKVNEWKNIMNRRFPDFKILQGNGTQYKTKMKDGTIVYTTLYDVAEPKMNIQGKHICLREYVMDVLPEVYKDVCTESSSLKLPLNARVKLNGETIFTCDVCDKKYVRKATMKKHMQTKHSQNKILQHPTDQRITAETVKPTELNRTEEASTSGNEIRMNCSLEEIAEIVEETEPDCILNNFQCGVCGKICDIESELTNHIDQEHEETTTLLTKDAVLHSPDNCTNTEAKAVEKELEILKRRHEQLRAKFDNTVITSWG